MAVVVNTLGLPTKLYITNAGKNHDYNVCWDDMKLTNQRPVPTPIAPGVLERAKSETYRPLPAMAREA